MNGSNPPGPQAGTWLAVNAALRKVALLGLASLAAGVAVGGVGGRIVMSVSAAIAPPEMIGRLTENGNRIGEFTIGGTIGLLVFVGLLGGLAGSVVVVSSDPWLRWAGPMKGLGFGVLTLAVFGYETFGSVDFRLLKPVAVNVGMFLGLMLLYGFAVSVFYRLFETRLPKAGAREQIVYLILVAFGAVPLLVAFLNFSSSDFCGCDPAYEIGAALLFMAGATAVDHASTAFRLPGWLTLTASTIGYVSLVAALVFGLNRTVDNLQRLM